MRIRGSTVVWLLGLAIGIGALISVPTVVQRIRFDRLAQEVKTARAALPDLKKGDTLSPLFHAVAEIVRPAVVVVQVTERVKETRTVGSDTGDFWQHLFGDHSDKPLPPAHEHVYGLGSGIIVDANDGYILTNWHGPLHAPRIVPTLLSTA